MTFTRVALFWLCLLVAGLLLAASGAFGSAAVTDLRAHRRNGQLRLELHAVELMDERTASTIDSGLPGTCVYYISLLDSEDKIQSERLAEFHLRLDLWENSYQLNCPNGLHSFVSLAAADSAWSHLPDLDICETAALDPLADYHFQVRISVQPLAPKDQDRLSRYVTESGSGKREELALDLGALFGRLLKGSRGGRDETRFTSGSFRIGDLEERP